MEVSKKTKTIVLVIWAISFTFVMFLYGYKRSIFQDFLGFAFSYSYYLGLGIFLIAGCLRGFTFIPSTPFIIVGLFFFSQNTLLVLVLTGILVSSTLVYYFAKSLRLGESFNKKHLHRIIQIKKLLKENELPVIIALSFFPLFPTDVICYVCGSLNIKYGKFILGILIGEGIACSLYIYFGAYIIHMFNNLL